MAGWSPSSLIGKPGPLHEDELLSRLRPITAPSRVFFLFLHINN